MQQLPLLNVLHTNINKSNMLVPYFQFNLRIYRTSKSHFVVFGFIAAKGYANRVNSFYLCTKKNMYILKHSQFIAYILENIDFEFNRKRPLNYYVMKPSIYCTHPAIIRIMKMQFKSNLSR